jgi:hypothetical protein
VVDVVELVEVDELDVVVVTKASFVFLQVPAPIPDVAV